MYVCMYVSKYVSWVKKRVDVCMRVNGGTCASKYVRAHTYITYPSTYLPTYLPGLGEELPIGELQGRPQKEEDGTQEEEVGKGLRGPVERG